MYLVDITPGQLRSARALAGWKQSDLAERTGLSRVTISDFESGKIEDPRTSTLRSIMAAFEAAGIVLTCDGGVQHKRES